MATLAKHPEGPRATLLSRHLVGRSRLADLRMTEPSVSGEHAVLCWTGREWELHDLGSRNGTIVDGRRLAPGERVGVARGAAMTQGMSLPPMKRAKSGFLRMRAFCGDTEVTPIHPFVVEHRISESEAIYEGLYVFDPAVLGPQCGTVKLTVYSENDPDKGDTRVVDPKVLQQITRDFAPL